MKDIYLERVKDQFSQCCQFFRVVTNEHDGDVQCTNTLFLEQYFELIFDIHNLNTLRTETDEKENMSIAFWSKVFFLRPYYRELSLFLIIIHSIPPTTVDVERIFKTTKKLENEGRASLAGSTKEMLTVLKPYAS